MRLGSGVEVLDHYCFSDTTIRRIFIPDNVREVGDFAFSLCPFLENVQFSENSRLKSIGLGAFVGTRVYAFSTPPSLRKLGAAVFCGSDTLRVVCLNEGLEQLGTDECDDDGYECQGVFQNSAVCCVKLPSTLRRIARSTFQGCKNLDTITLPALLETIGESCFCGSGIVRIEIPPRVEEVKNSVFRDCDALREVSFAEGSRLCTIGAYAFAHSGLERFVAPASLRQIGRGAFWSCRALRSAVLNDGLAILGTNVLN